jgi:glycosyltransferase involved in cell wall biosynthesis
VTLVVEHLNARNGADLIGREILIALSEARLPLTVVSRDRCPESPGREESPDTRWVTPPFREPFPKRLSRRTPRRLAKWALRRALDTPRRRALAKVVDSPIVVNGFANSFALDYRKAPAGADAVLVIHDSPTRYDVLGQPPLSWAVGEMNRFSRYVFSSERLRAAWSRLGEIGRKQCVIIPNCCREEEVRRALESERREIRRRLGWAENCVVGVCVASLQQRKGQDLLVRALPRIRARVPQAQLVLVGVPAGADGERFARSLSEEATREGCADRIAMAGFHDDALDFIHAADLFVLASRSESMPVTILEAMAMKTPVIASNIDAIPDLVIDGTTGRLFPCDDVDGLANAFVALASDASGRAAFGEAGHARYWSCFSRKIVWARYVDAIGRVARDEPW